MTKKKRIRQKPSKKKCIKKRSDNPQKRPRYPSLKGLKVREAAAVVSCHLAKAGHDPVLVGQTCAFIYGAKKEACDRLEFSIKDYEPERVRLLMAKIGFRNSEEHMFTRENSPFNVLLSTFPILIGDYPVDDFGLIKTSKGNFKALTPTDCVKQRLSSFYRFCDEGALEEAARVARRQRIDMEAVKRWSEWEWSGDKFAIFADLIAKP